MTAELRARLQGSLGAAYRIERELGGGGMSRVFVAEETALGRTVVVKVLPPDLAASISVERFKREILVAAKLQQANIVPVLSAGEADGLPYFTMPYVEGHSLRGRLAATGALSIAETAGVLKDVARALAYAHEHGVVHRDIKPDNVLLSGGTAVVTDFGIAKAISAARVGADGATRGESARDLSTDALTGLGMSLGTPTYMAPEQATGDPSTDHRADLYAFGTMAYEMLTGLPPFHGLPVHRLVAMQMTETPRPVRELRPDTPPALAVLIARCLAKDPERRPQSAADVARVLDALASGSSGDAPASALLAPRVPLWRALALWAVAAAGVPIVAWAAVIAIGLPDWVFPASVTVVALGLPALLFTHLVQRTARRALSATPTRTPGGTPVQSTVATMAVKASPHVTWRRAALGGVAAVVALVLATGGYMALRAMGVGPAGSLAARGVLGEGEPLLVAEFRASGADSTLGQVVSEAVRTNLAQSRAVRVVSMSVVGGALARMRRPADARLDLALAREVALREGIKAVVDGAVTPVGSGFLVTARLVLAESGDELASYQQAAESLGDLIPAIDRVTRSLRGRIGESLRSVRASPPLARVSTASVEALRKYTEAHRANYASDYARAVLLAREAVALDSNFAMAWVLLGRAAGNGGIPLPEFDVDGRAFQLRDRLPELERATVVGAWYQGGRATEDRARAMSAYERVVELDPTNVPALNLLALQYGTRRDHVRAEQLFRRAIAADTTISFPRWNLIRTLANQGRLDEAAAQADTLVRHFPRHPNVEIAGWQVWYLRGRLDSLRAGCERLLARQGPAPTAANTLIGANCLAALARLHGRLGDAMRYRREAYRLDSLRLARWAPALLVLDSLAMTVPLQVDGVHATRALDSMAFPSTVPGQRTPWLEAAALVARSGRAAAARAMLDRIDAQSDSTTQRIAGDQRQLVLGEIALAERRWDEAVRAFRAADVEYDGAPISCSVCVLPDLGRAYDLAARPDSAIAVYERFLNESFAERIGTDARALPAVLRRLGELYETRGDRARAVALYGRFLALWRHADPALQPIVSDVRARVTRLGGDLARLQAVPLRR